MFGQHFDVMRPGIHVFAQVPKHAEDILLKITADVKRAGGACADMYINEVNITGQWAVSKPNEAVHYTIDNAHENPAWLTFNEVGVKVVKGTTKTGVQYLNVLVRNLNQVKLPVGGLLGEDDHLWASTPEPGCRKKIVLLESR